jgi:thiazole synthase
MGAHGPATLPYRQWRAAPYRGGASVADLVADIGLNPAKVAVERNGEIAPRSTLAQVVLGEGDVLEIVHFVGGGDVRLMIPGPSRGAPFAAPDRGHGQVQGLCPERRRAGGDRAEIVTVAVRRVNVSDPKAPMLTDFIDPKKVTYLPNTAGCFTAEERSAPCALRVRRAAGIWSSWRCWAKRARFIPTCARR